MGDRIRIKDKFYSYQVRKKPVFRCFFLPDMKRFINIKIFLTKYEMVIETDSNKEKNEKEEILEKTAKEYFCSAEDEYKKERYNSAVVLYFKALVALIDLYIFQKTGNTPSSHTERFRITQKNFQNVYDLLDKDFPFYQDSYIHFMTK